MANHPSAAKRNRQRLRRTLENRRIVSATRTIVKKARAALAGGDVAAAKAAVVAASVALAKAASKGSIKSGTASRTTSRINVALAKLAAK